MIKYLIVGLGNIGPEYHETRHNIGFMTVEEITKRALAYKIIFISPQEIDERNILDRKSVV